MTEAELRWEYESQRERVSWMLSHAELDYENEMVQASNCFNARGPTKKDREKALAKLKSMTPEWLIEELRKQLADFDNDINSYRPEEREMTTGDL